MAIDKAVDSTKLNASLTYEANRIRAKTGGSSNITFDFANEKGFGDAIDAISGDGGGNANVSQDANGYIVLDDAAPGGGGGGNTNVLLASFVAEQNVSTIQISDDFSGYNLYLLELVGSTNTTEWIYPEFNGIANTGNYLAPRSGATNWNAVIPIICGASGTPQFTDGSRLACPTFTSSGTAIYAPLNTGVLSSIALHLYNGQNVFTAGFTVKLWGVPLSTTA